MQRTEDGTWLDDHSVRTTNTNTVVFDVAPGTYTITESTPPSTWQLSNIITSGGTVSTNLSARTATVTVTTGQSSFIEFDNVNIISSAIVNTCGSPYVETFGVAGTTTSSYGPVLPNGYTPYHYNNFGTGSVLEMESTRL